MVYKQILTLILICISVLYDHNCIEGTKFVEVEGEQAESKEGRSIETHHPGIISSLFSDVINDNSSTSNVNIHYAGFTTPSPMLTGTRARISAWGIPDVNYNSDSGVFIAVWNKNSGNYYGMAAGFHVYPKLYSGGTDLRLFAAWVTTEDNTCYSTTCQGFVVSNVSGAPVLGGKVAPLSTYNGKDYFVTLSIKKDQKTQDWSLYRDDNNNPILIGWWPKALFNNTFDYATKIVWTGGITYHKNETSPAMGSGHVACEGANKAAYMSNIKVFDEFGQIAEPDVIYDITDRSDCFTTSDFKKSPGKGYNFFYGGPAVCKN